MPDPGHVVPWELTRLEKRDELQPGEVIHDSEEVWTRFSKSRGRVGALFLTDLRVLFITTGVITRRTRLISVPLETIGAVDVTESPRWGEDRGAIALDAAGDGEPQRVEFERITGGLQRAAELADAIRRQQGLLAKPA